VAWSSDIGILSERLCAVAARNLTQEEWDRFLPFAPYRPTCSDISP
jgi:hypothetical protein